MAPPSQDRPRYVVVSGVTGSGKSTVARLLAERLGLPFADGDDFHSPANIAKMSAGTPLDDTDRRPWLESIGRWLHARDTEDTGAVVACSALKRHHRDTLRAACPDALFLHLTADHDVLASRLGSRSGHFMPTSLLDSQLAALEPLEPDEPGTALDATPDPATIVDRAVNLLRRGRGAPGAGRHPDDV
ncbi:gluconokinase [Streptomyces sp. B93]|uniref:gluconokinase n=1 Tax=Streptomyces sp. B93 TaxID=2824875 RepID=UPI001B374E3D|nr:gluconokinase [Streptomyces sp. B93]MBQ1089405.1 gluconokinase [Streptomyces sp. B93]